MVKDKVRRFLNCNVYLNNLAYSMLFQDRVMRIKEYQRKFQQDDYLKDIRNLKEFVKDIKRDKEISASRNTVFENLNMYGIWKSMFGNVLDYKDLASPAIEHGLVLHDTITSDLTKTARMACATLGEFRKEIIQKKMDIPVFCMGSYIYYADSFYDEKELAETKKQMGKTLLVFPAHSAEESNIRNDSKRFLDVVKEYAKEFDTVLINVYWWNLCDPMIEIFENEGYRIITCGFRDDINFLKRQKDYFELADLVIGDGVGTHIGYALSCNVPYVHINVNTIFEASSNIVDGMEMDFLQKHTKYIAHAFENNESIYEKEKICNYYWGNNEYKTKEEIKDILEICNDLTKYSGGFTHLRYKTADTLLNKYVEEDIRKYILLKNALPKGGKGK